MLVALLIAVVIGAALGAATTLDSRFAVADDAKTAALVGLSGAVAGWALLDSVLGLGHNTLDIADPVGAIIGAAVLLTVAWRGRRRTFAEHRSQG